MCKNFRHNVLLGYPYIFNFDPSTYTCQRPEQAEIAELSVKGMTVESVISDLAF